MHEKIINDPEPIPNWYNACKYADTNLGLTQCQVIN